MAEIDYRQTLGALNRRLLRHPMAGAARVGKRRREVHQPARPVALRCHVVSLTKSCVHVHTRHKTHVIPSASSAEAAKPRAAWSLRGFLVLLRPRTTQCCQWKRRCRRRVWYGDSWPRGQLKLSPIKQAPQAVSRTVTALEEPRRVETG